MIKLARAAGLVITTAPSGRRCASTTATPAPARPRNFFAALVPPTAPSTSRATVRCPARRYCRRTSAIAAGARVVLGASVSRARSDKSIPIGTSPARRMRNTAIAAVRARHADRELGGPMPLSLSTPANRVVGQPTTSAWKRRGQNRRRAPPWFTVEQPAASGDINSRRHPEVPLDAARNSAFDRLQTGSRLRDRGNPLGLAHDDVDHRAEQFDQTALMLPIPAAVALYRIDVADRTAVNFSAQARRRWWRWRSNG